MRAFVDEHRENFGVEPICKVLQVAPSGYRKHAARRRDPSRRCWRALRDERLIPQVERAWQANLRVTGPTRSGGSSIGKARAWRVAQWSG